MTQLEKTLKLDFMGRGLEVKSNSSELISRLSKDFSYFVSESLESAVNFSIRSILEDNCSLSIPKVNPTFSRKNSTSYDSSGIRYNDYGNLISSYDFKNEVGVLSSSFIERLHEITYLLILSRVGKYFDLKGIHKIHAMGFIYKDVCCVGMMNMGVGKSTLLLELLKDSEIELLSDDTPLVNSQGGIEAFPLRIGVEEIPKGLELKNIEENLYELKREEYGLKKLISLNGFKNEIGSKYSKLVLFEGTRGGEGIRKSSKWKLWVALQKHMVIGIGLPLIFEYFWEKGFTDFLRKTKIFFLRQRAALKLVRSCDYYCFSLGESSEENARALKNLLSD